jgi:hypothetical protein
MIQFEILDNRYTQEHLGLIPLFLSEIDERSAAEQFDDNYAHGGGWSPMPGWKMGSAGEIIYPSEQPLKPIAQATLRQEVIRFYPYAWVSITQPDGTFEISRMD